MYEKYWHKLYSRFKENKSIDDIDPNLAKGHIENHRLDVQDMYDDWIQIAKDRMSKDQLSLISEPATSSNIIGKAATTSAEHSVPSLEKGLLKSFGETLAKHPGKFGLGGAATAGALYGGKKAYDHFTKEDPVTTTIDTTQDTLSDNPYLLPGVAGLVGTALAGGALYSYLKNRNKK